MSAQIVSHITRKTLTYLPSDMLEDGAARARATMTAQRQKAMPRTPGQLWERAATPALRRKYTSPDRLRVQDVYFGVKHGSAQRKGRRAELGLPNDVPAQRVPLARGGKIGPGFGIGKIATPYPPHLS